MKYNYYRDRHCLEKLRLLYIGYNNTIIVLSLSQQQPQWCFTAYTITNKLPTSSSKTDFLGPFPAKTLACNCTPIKRATVFLDSIVAVVIDVLTLRQVIDVLTLRQVVARQANLRPVLLSHILPGSAQ